MENLNKHVAPEDQLKKDIDQFSAIESLEPDYNLKSETMMESFHIPNSNYPIIGDPNRPYEYERSEERHDESLQQPQQQPLEAIHKMEVFEGEIPALNGSSSSPNTFSLEASKRKRRNEMHGEENTENKKSSLSSTTTAPPMTTFTTTSNGAAEEKKGQGQNLRKNIRDVMDETQLDTDTLAAQREESERLARVAEQQKIIREYQRQTAVNRQFVRTQNRVLSLLKSGNTYAKPAEISESKSLNEIVTTEPERSELLEKKETIGSANSIATTSSDEKTGSEVLSDTDEKPQTELSSSAASTSMGGPSPISEQIPSDIVTIEDSSSEDDCIMLSDDEEEELEDEPEDDPNNSGLHVKDTYNVPDEHGQVVVNVGHPEGEEDIFVAPQIAKTIKPHQIGGVRFLFDNVIESTKRFKHSSGFGCILAHSMGLGKTLQVVCFCDIFLRHTPSKSVLCVMPINTLQNWVSEFNMWIPRESADEEYVRPRQFDVFVLNDQHKTLTARAKVVLKWAEQGGVLLIGYELFRLLALKLMPTRRRRGKNANAQNSATEANARLMESMHQALVKPGPDLVICDEGHRIKNAHAGISLALKQIRTRRRIVLTGYPLQNNLLEYWCMVDFVRPNYLGTRTEFCNMFERPIQNGQCIDSTPEDIKLMRYRAHVLHSLLVGFVQRRSHMVLQQTLPQKLEYVILTRMTDFQRQLYQTFMNDVVRSKAVPNPLKAFAVCCKIWNHPDVLYNFLKKRETDLDLEIDDSEVANDQVLPQTAQNLKTVNSIKVGDIEKNNVSIGEHVQPSAPIPPTTSITTTANEVSKADCVDQLKNKVFSSGESCSLQQVKPNGDINTSSSELNYQNTTAPTNQSYNNMYYTPANYYQQSNDPISYSNECESNNFWQESNVPYFFYPTLPSSVSYPTKPDYVGMMDKDINEKLNNESGNVTSSSEIVDLDTKEIKTIETNINMSQNPILNNNSSLPKQEVEIKAEVANTTTHLEALNTKDEKLKNETKEEKNAPTTINPMNATIEKETPQKLKSDESIPYEWGIELMKKYEPGLITSSPKMEIFFCILNESIKLGDRVLLFSQSLLTLNLIESFLQSNIVPGYNAYWSRNVSYFRLDGSTTSQEREKLVNDFNTNPNVKLFLISTRAGSLGINLVGANRVIVFDASWNPCHDTQAVYRIYRYGQRKSCYVYRIVMDKCLEKKIYDRQIKKQGMSDRVVDECNPDAHLSMKDVTNLCHDYDDDDVDDKNNKSATPTFSQPFDSYADVIVQKVVEQYQNCLSKEPFHHESLLIDRKEKKLSQAEKRQAHRGYEMEKKASIKQTSLASINKIQYRIVRNDGTVVNRPVASIRPMQTIKTQNANKSGSIRSTRWIPAEVWQRQGMTAQEMTLPLDVVIPTNSSDKSNIVLRAGQRVMVLKSAKGIYMQLDSGKIIAIRTSNKSTEENKTGGEKGGEVIDITSEGDGDVEKNADTTKSGTSSTKTTPGLKHQSNESVNGGSIKNCSQDEISSTPTTSISNSNSGIGINSITKNKVVYRRNSQVLNEENDSFRKETKEIKAQQKIDENAAEVKQRVSLLNTNTKPNTPSSIGYSSKMYGKSVVPSYVNKNNSKLISPTSQKLLNAAHITPQPQHPHHQQRDLQNSGNSVLHETTSVGVQNQQNTSHTHLAHQPNKVENKSDHPQYLQQEKDIKRTEAYFKSPVHSNLNNANQQQQYLSRAIPKDEVNALNTDKNANATKQSNAFMAPLQQQHPTNEKRMSGPTADIYGQKMHDTNIGATRTSNAAPTTTTETAATKLNYYVQSQKNLKPLASNANTTVKPSLKCSYPNSQKDNCETSSESKMQTPISTIGNSNGTTTTSTSDYLPTSQCQASNKHGQPNRVDAVPSYLQQQPFAQPPQQQPPTHATSKLHHLHHVPHYNMQHSQYSNPVPPLHMGIPSQCINPDSNLAPNAFFPSREVSNYPTPYESIYNSSSNISGASCDYPSAAAAAAAAQFTDYSAYSSYNPTQYHSQLHAANSYPSASAASLSSNPYNLHWSPLVTPSPLTEQYNVMYPGTYSQNGAQSNQWCNP